MVLIWREFKHVHLNGLSSCVVRKTKELLQNAKEITSRTWLTTALSISTKNISLKNKHWFYL